MLKEMGPGGGKSYFDYPPAVYRAFLAIYNQKYDDWFFAPKTQRMFDAWHDAYYSKHPNPKVRQEWLRDKQQRERKEKGQREPRRGPRIIRVLPGQLTSGQRFAILKRDNYRCRICGANQNTDNTVELEVDHITARIKGGNNDPLNLWTLCALCNRGKGTQDL